MSIDEYPKVFINIMRNLLAKGLHALCMLKVTEKIK
jgi:hypothetical protein